MLAAVGAASIEELFEDIPQQFRHPELRLPAPLSEMELRAEMTRLAEANFSAGNHPSFLGAGVYNHFCPAVVGPLVTRGEFLTSYTPYQPEVSQGTLQGNFEFQTLTAQLFGMEVSNAGMYDGASSLAEAGLMACRVAKRARIAIVDTVNPHYADAVRAYARPQAIEVYPAQYIVLTELTKNRRPGPLRYDGRRPRSSTSLPRNPTDDDEISVHIHDFARRVERPLCGDTQ